MKQLNINDNREKEESYNIFVKEINENKNNRNRNKKYIQKFIYLNLFIINLALYLLYKNIKKKFNILENSSTKYIPINNFTNYISFIKKYSKSPTTFFSLPKDIKFKPLMTKNELRAFLYFMKPEKIYFEFGSGGSTNIASYFKVKTYSVESDKKWHEKLKNNGIIANYITIDLKSTYSGYPGKDTTINDWKKYIQAYKKEYNADIILIDGRFRVACALDIFSKIRIDTAVLIHDYETRFQYHILEKYYIKIDNWDTLALFIKNPNIKAIPENIYNFYLKEKL